MTSKPSSSRYARGVAAVLIGAGAVSVFAAVYWTALQEKVQATQDLSPIVLQLDWVHGGDFAGFYAAEENGYYQDEGVSVSYLQGGPTVDPIASVVTGEAHFGTSNAYDIINARAKGNAVKSIACILQRSPFVFAALESADFRHPRDLAGKTVRIPSSLRQILDAFLAKGNLTNAEITTVQTRDTDRFTSGEIQVWGGYITGALRRMQSSGIALAIVHPGDFGIHAYHECIFTREDLLENNPSLVVRFLRATLDGWSYTIENTDHTATLVAKRTGEDDTKDALAYVMSQRPLFNLGNVPIGWMSTEKWAGMVRDIQATTPDGQPLDSSSVYTLDILNQVFLSNDMQGGTS